MLFFSTSSISLNSYSNLTCSHKYLFSAIVPSLFLRYVVLFLLTFPAGPLSLSLPLNFVPTSDARFRSDWRKICLNLRQFPTLFLEVKPFVHLNSTVIFQYSLGFFPALLKALHFIGS